MQGTADKQCLSQQACCNGQPVAHTGAAIRVPRTLQRCLSSERTPPPALRPVPLPCKQGRFYGGRRCGERRTAESRPYGRKTPVLSLRASAHTGAAIRIPRPLQRYLLSGRTPPPALRPVPLPCEQGRFYGGRRCGERRTAESRPYRRVCCLLPEKKPLTTAVSCAITVLAQAIQIIQNERSVVV